MVSQPEDHVRFGQQVGNPAKVALPHQLRRKVRVSHQAVGKWPMDWGVAAELADRGCIVVVGVVLYHIESVIVPQGNQVQ